MIVKMTSVTKVTFTMGLDAVRVMVVEILVTVVCD